MGFVRAKAFHDLQFGGELAGLEIRVRARTGHTMTAVAELAQIPTQEDPFGLLPLFMDSLDRWNLEYPDGSLVPRTFEAFWGHDMEFIRAVLQAYLVTLDLPYSAAAHGRGDSIHPALDPGGQVPTPAPAVLDRPPPVSPVDGDMNIPGPLGPDLEHLERFVVWDPPPTPVTDAVQELTPA